MNKYAIQRVNFCGVAIDLFDKKKLIQCIDYTIKNNQKAIIANHNLHSLYLCTKNICLRSFFQKADYIHADGMSIVFMGQLFNSMITRKHRLTYLDWTHDVLTYANMSGYRIFYLGSKQCSLDKGVRVCKERYPNIHWRFHHGYFDFDSEDNMRILNKINNFHPHILYIGMGMPRQEEWIDRYSSSVNTHVILPCGAVIDYISGTVPTPPRWIGRIGFEWLFRLCCEPQRLWYRYIIEPAVVFKYLLFNKFKIPLHT